MEVRRVDGGGLVCAACERADTPWRRLRGLLGRTLTDDAGLLITPCRSVHMLGMRYAIDAVFLDRELRVLRVAADLRPGRMAGQRGARSVLELPAGVCARIGLRVGDRLVLQSRVR